MHSRWVLPLKTIQKHAVYSLGLATLFYYICSEVILYLLPTSIQAECLIFTAWIHVSEGLPLSIYTQPSVTLFTAALLTPSFYTVAVHSRESWNELPLHAYSKLLIAFFRKGCKIILERWNRWFLWFWEIHVCIDFDFQILD